MVERETADTFDLNNDVTIEIQVASYRSIRGYTVCAALLDELAFWQTDDASDPDYAIINAIRPSMATVPNALLLSARSPYASRGALHDAHRRLRPGRRSNFGLAGRNKTMNPTVPQSIIDAATERDPSFARAEYFAEFRSDIETFIMREAAATQSI